MFDLPSSDRIAAALDEQLASIALMLRPLQAASRAKALSADDRAELTHWSRLERAATKALAMLAKVELTRRSWGLIVGSASRPGDVRHAVRREAGLWVCGCEAGVKEGPGLPCWHSTLALAIDMAEDAAERDAAIEAPVFPGARPVDEIAAELYG